MAFRSEKCPCLILTWGLILKWPGIFQHPDTDESIY